MKLLHVGVLFAGFVSLMNNSYADGILSCQTSVQSGLPFPDRCDIFAFDFANNKGIWHPWGCSGISDGQTELVIETVEDMQAYRHVIAKTVEPNGNYTRFWIALGYSRSLEGSFQVNRIESQSFLAGEPYTLKHQFSKNESENGYCNEVK